MLEITKVTADDRFEFATKPHGQGGFGRIIRGRDNYLERDIAVKVLSPLLTQFSQEPELQERFKREARILARLSHPNVPAIYDVVFDPDQFLIVFQFVEGRTLRDILEEEGPADLAKVQVWFRQVASALEHAHALGIVHRDVKPENIIITSDRDTASLVDWGIAISPDDAKRLTDSNGWVGTPGYMSPEQQAGEEVDHRSDLYSLGVTLYEALAGKPIPQGQYEELSSFNQAIPPQIDELVRLCLESVSRRLDSAKQFGAKLAGALLPSRPISEVLGHGRLHEVSAALRELTAESFMRLPDGQRALVLVKLDDLVDTDDPQLDYAAAQFLELMITRGLLLDAEGYREIARPAMNRGFERNFQGKPFGRESVREAIKEAAVAAHGAAFEVLASEFLAFVSRTDLDDKPAWFLQELREILNVLLANPSCETSAAGLASTLRLVNKAQRRRQLTSRQ